MAVLSPKITEFDVSQSAMSSWTVACQAPLSMSFSRQEYWCGLPFPSPIYSCSANENLENLWTVFQPLMSDGKESACNVGDLGLIPGSGGFLEKGMATHSSILAWKIPWTEEPGRLQSMRT